ncbi:MAG TPA: hypothetical protein VNQ76_09960 [Planctomicrobium sp.]|nr:hypothetical protein [Planctomicrobium sp.]
MLLPVLLCFLLLLLACLTQVGGIRASRFARILVGTGSAVALGLWLLLLLTPSESVQAKSLLTGVSTWFRDDAVSRASLLVGVLCCLLVSLLDRHPATLSATCWSAGLLGLASIGNHPILLWGAMQFSVLALMFYGRTDNTVSLWKRHSSLVVGSALFASGLLLTSFTPLGSNGPLMGSVFLICGIGGMVRWFPFPRVVGVESSFDPVLATVGHRLLPTLTAGVVLWRLSEFFPFSDQQAFLLVMAGLFSLAFGSVRLMRENLLSRRLALNALATLSFLTVPIFLQNWERGHPLRDWAQSSNLPTGQTLFVSILVCETIALLLLLSGQRLLQPDGENADITETLGGVARRQPVKSIPLLVALFSFSGMPPFPGFWWRFGLILTCLLPHRQSTLTLVNERDNSVTFLAVALLVLMIFNALGNLQLLKRVLFETPFRVRDNQWTWTAVGAVMISGLTFLGAALFPLSLDQRFAPGLQATPVLSPSQKEPALEDQTPAPKEGTGIPKVS